MPERWEDAIFGRSSAIEWPVATDASLGDRNGPMAWAEYLLVRSLSRSLMRLPDRGRELGVSLLARVARRIDPSHTRAAQDFIATALPELSPEECKQRALEAWKHLMRVSIVSEAVSSRMIGKPLSEHFDVDISDETLALIGSGTGAVFVSPHVGHWELAPGVLVSLGFEPFYAVGKPPHNRPLSRYLHEARERVGIRVLPRRGAMQAIPKILKSGGFVGMLLDQRARLKPVVAPFFGRPANCDRSAAVLLRRMRVPVILGACYATEDPWRFKVSFHTGLSLDQLAGASNDEVVHAMNKAMEELILREPLQYFWLHDRYRKVRQQAAPTAPARTAS